MTIPKTFWDQPIDEETIRKKVDLNDFEDQFKIKAPVVSKDFFFFFFFLKKTLILHFFNYYQNK